MGPAASRFRKLPPPRAEAKPRAAEPRTRERSTTGDLFDHFGVRSDREFGLPAAIVDATPCSTCGWLRRTDELEQPCPLCARARPDSTDPR